MGTRQPFNYYFIARAFIVWFIISSFLLLCAFIIFIVFTFFIIIYFLFWISPSNFKIFFIFLQLPDLFVQFLAIKMTRSIKSTHELPKAFLVHSNSISPNPIEWKSVFYDSIVNNQFASFFIGISLFCKFGLDFYQHVRIASFHINTIDEKSMIFVTCFLEPITDKSSSISGPNAVALFLCLNFFVQSSIDLDFLAVSSEQLMILFFSFGFKKMKHHFMNIFIINNSKIVGRIQIMFPCKQTLLFQ